MPRKDHPSGHVLNSGRLGRSGRYRLPNTLVFYIKENHEGSWKTRCVDRRYFEGWRRQRSRADRRERPAGVASPMLRGVPQAVLEQECEGNLCAEIIANESGGGDSPGIGTIHLRRI